MNIKAQENNRNLEIAKWSIIAILLFIVVVLNYFCPNWNLLLRTTLSILLIIIASSISLTTTKGKSIIIFMQETRIEMRKIIWPTPQETLHITLIVLAVSSTMSLILWGLDSILIRLISFITNLRL